MDNNGPVWQLADMPTCIYCRATTDGNESVDHPLPQALGTSDYPLKRGAVCNTCNTYLSELDRNFCDHHHLSAMIVFGQLRGTKDRVRAGVHPEFSFDVSKQHLTMQGGTGTVEDGTLVIRHPGNDTFDPWKFSRGLHRVALGLYAMNAGEEAALHRRYDNVRRYVRSPAGRHEYWPYRQRPTDRLLGNRSLPPALAAQGFKLAFASADCATYAYLNLFVSEFVVALDGDLQALSEEHLNQLALVSPQPQSIKPWQCHDGSKQDSPTFLTPDIFEQ